MSIDVKIVNGPVRARTEVCVPGSKSFTHRVLIAAALSDGICNINHPLFSEDTLLTINALERMGGVRIEACEIRQRSLNRRQAGALHGTHLSFWEFGHQHASAGRGCCASGDYRFYGTSRMHQRPDLDLLDALNQIKVSARSVDGTGCPPIIITGGSAFGGTVRLDCTKSSQYLSALLLIAPCARSGMEILLRAGSCF